MVMLQSMKDIEGYLTKEQVEKLIQNTATKRDQVLCTMLWLTGRRISEVLSVKKKHIDWIEKKILFPILKKRRTLNKWKVVPQKLIDVLHVYTAGKDSEDYLFPSPYVKGNHLSRQQAYRVINDAAAEGGIFQVGNKPIHPHVFRHSFAVHYMKNTNSKSSLRILQQYLEHGDISTTSVYLQFGGEEIEKDLNDIF